MQLNSDSLKAGLIALSSVLVPSLAFASYMGPGLGLGAISTALALLGAIAMGLVAVVWYPVKRAWRRLRRPGC